VEFRTAWKRATRAAGLPGLHVHDLRARLYATWNATALHAQLR
jgi:hypothetical protein